MWQVQRCLRRLVFAYSLLIIEFKGILMKLKNVALSISVDLSTVFWSRPRVKGLKINSAKINYLNYPTNHPRGLLLGRQQGIDGLLSIICSLPPD